MLFTALCRLGALSPRRGGPETRIRCYLQYFLDPPRAVEAILAPKWVSRLGAVLDRARRRGEKAHLDPKRRKPKSASPETFANFARRRPKISVSRRRGARNAPRAGESIKMGSCDVDFDALA